MSKIEFNQNNSITVKKYNYTLNFFAQYMLIKRKILQLYNRAHDEIKSEHNRYNINLLCLKKTP
jgi:hypothetical protein